MGGMTALIMSAAVMGFMMIPIANMSTMTARAKSDLQARILLEAEVDHARRVWSVDQQNFDSHRLNNDKCTTSSDVRDNGDPVHGYTPDGFNFNVTCTVGTESAGGEDVMLAYPQASNNPGQYTDNDLDGFEDKTGLPTHYDQCYAGWKGDGFKHKACDIGVSYVIPMYQEIYQ